MYSDIFSSTRGYLCAAAPPPKEEGYSISSHDHIEVCFLRLSAKDADWIRQKFASVKPGHVLLNEDFQRIQRRNIIKAGVNLVLMLLFFHHPVIRIGVTVFRVCRAGILLMLLISIAFWRQ